MPSVSNLFKPGGLAWRPDANSINAPEGTLLRADNMVPDEDGALSVRRGSRELYLFPDGTEDVHSLYTYEGSSGYTYRMMGADSQVYKNPGPGNHTAHWEVRIAEAQSFEVLTQRNYTGGSWEKDYASTGDVGPVTYSATWEDDYITGLVTDQEPVNWNVTFDGTGDIAFGDDHQQSFFARGTTAKKFDGKSFLSWGIPKPSAVATLSANAASSTSIITFATGEANVTYGPLVSSYPDTTTDAIRAFVNDENGNANQATSLIPGRIYGINYGFVTKGYASDTDLYDVGAYTGSDQDVFDIAVKFEDPTSVRKFQIRVDVGSGTNPTLTNYSFDFDIKNGVDQYVRDTQVDGANAYEEKVQSSLDPIDPKDKPRVNTPEQVKNIIANVGNTSSASVGVTTPSPGTWMHFSIARGQFKKTGGESGRSWETVKQVSIVIETTDGVFPKFYMSDLVIKSAGAGMLSGEYQVLYRWVRETDRYYEMSPPSDPSATIALFNNSLRVTIPGAAQTAADDQVTTVWIYIFGGYLDTYYRVTTATADPQLSTDIVVDLAKNEVEILTENEKLEPYTDEPRDNIIAIAGPWNGRLFTFTSEGYVYPSLQTTPNLFNTYQVIDLSNQGDPLWMVKTSSGVHCGCERDVIFLAGTGDEDADRVVIDLYPHPLNIGTPPFDRANFVDGNSILYRSTDGLIMLASQGLTHIPDDGIRLLWRGQDRHGVSALNTQTGRFRVTVDGKIMYVLAPEGATTEGTTAVYRLDLGKGQWSRLIYPDPLLNIFNEPDGTLIAGTNNGKVLELEYGTGDDNAVKPSVTIWTPYSDGGNPLVRKDAFDIQFHCDTNANTATVEVYKDGAASATSSYTLSTTIPQVYRLQTEDVGAFIRAQLKLTGTFDEFQLSMLDMTYRERPQHMTYLDTGYVVGNDPADLVWLQEVEIDANSPSDLVLMTYLDDRLFDTQTVTVTADVRSVYRVQLPRGSKSRRPRLVVKTSAADGAGEVGFDPYFVRVRTRDTGNQSSGSFKTIWPVGTAP